MFNNTVRVLSIAFCLCFIPNAAIAQDNSKTESIRKEILRLEEIGRQKSLSGNNKWDDLIARNAYMIAFDGTVIIYKKGESLPSLPLKSFDLSEMICRVYGDVAVVTGLAKIEAEIPDKKPYSFQMRFLNVWKRSSNGWRIVVSERTLVKSGASSSENPLNRGIISPLERTKVIH